jgi:hypothetical protein
MQEGPRHCVPEPSTRAGLSHLHQTARLFLWRFLAMLLLVREIV